jgi:hypothetical protein
MHHSLQVPAAVTRGRLRGRGGTQHMYAQRRHGDLQLACRSAVQARQSVGWPVNGVNLGATVDTIMAKATFKWVGAGLLTMFK